MKKVETIELRLETIVGGGQALGTAEDGRKVFVWGGLPGEKVVVQLTKKKSNFAEGIVTKVLEPSPDRVAPEDPESYLSTSPWQIIDFAREQHFKAELISEAFTLHHQSLPNEIEIYTDHQQYHYRNKVEFSWYGATDPISGVDTLDLAFFRRGSKGKIVIEQSALLPPSIIALALSIRDKLRVLNVSARQLKTLLIRCDQQGNCVWQLYVKDTPCVFAEQLLHTDFPAQGGEIIYSTPKSPASVITERLAKNGNIVLSDTILGVPFHYATEGFFQVNLPVYEQALRDMQSWIDTDTTKKVVDLYAGVGSIGLTIGGSGVTLVEINEHAVREMRRNITDLGIDATPVLAASEQALDHISGDATIIVDPPRAGLHTDVIDKLLAARPARIIYLSCNPVTQARDCALLATSYALRFYKGYNFFPRTPHIEGLAVLDLRHMQ